MMIIINLRNCASKMSEYIKCFNETKYISFSVKHEELLEAYNKIWIKFSNLLNKKIVSEPMYKEKYFKN